jgi:hypothetical protein
MATVDVSEEEVIDLVSLTPPPAQGIHVDNQHPAFCGPSHFVWSRDDTYASEICYQEFDAEGPVGTPTCWFHGASDGRHDVHPSCDSTGTYIAWARESSYGAGSYDIWKMESGGSNAQAIQAGADDETMPAWSPSGTQIAFAWNRTWMGSDDYEIWIINADNGGGDTNVTDNTDEDDEPSWGPATLP